MCMFFFFFKLKTAYDSLISDWSSDVCSSDLWRTWLILAGRGFGKTRAGAEWVRSLAERDGTARIALIAATMAEARAIMVEGESGVLNIAPPTLRPERSEERSVGN